jgi:hypothetical protein
VRLHVPGLGLALALSLSFGAEAGSVPRETQGPARPAAAWIGGELPEEEFDRYLASRYGRDAVGRDATDYLIRERVLDAELRRRGAPPIPESELERRIRETDTELRQRQNHTLDEELARKGMDRATFVALFRKHLACERLVRQELAVPPEEPVRPEQQELWLTERVQASGVERTGLPPGVVARVEGVPVTEGELGRAIRMKLGLSELREAVRAAVGIRLVEAKAKALGVEATPEDVEAAIARRRARFGEGLRLEGVSFEQFLQAKGLTVDDLRSDGGVRGEALLAKAGALLLPDAEVDRRREAERARFDALFGEARRISWILLPAAAAPNAFVSRTYEEADRELAALATRAASPSEFARLASIHSGHAATRARGGEIGWCRRAERGVDGALLAAAFGAEPGKVVGPLRTAEGSALLLVRETRPGPEGAELRALVRGELVSDLYRSWLDAARIVTIYDPPTPAPTSVPASKPLR